MNTKLSNGLPSKWMDADICFGDVQFWKNGQKEFVQKGNLKLLSKEITIIHPTVFVKRKIYETFGGSQICITVVRRIMTCC